jgi:hypothetical protein
MARKRYRPEEIVAKLRQVEHGGRNPPNRVSVGDVLSAAPGVRRAQEAAGKLLSPARRRACIEQVRRTAACLRASRLCAGQPLGERLHRELQRPPSR